MLEPAILNYEKLKIIYLENIFKDRNKYLLIDGYIYFDLIKLEDSDLRKIQYVSKDSDGSIISYFEAINNIYSNFISNVLIINFTDEPNMLVAKDFINFFELLLCKKSFRKIVFYSITENPAFKLYKKFIEDTKTGELVGIYKKHYKLADGKYYDFAIFEIYKEKFEEWLKVNRKLTNK